MSVTLKLTFPAGRYHATPWGHHVNEGVVEWPPSPWRLLRALVATWKRKCPHLSEDAVKQVIESLLPPPHFFLPPARVAHIRQYMPWEKKGPADRVLVFDTFLSVNRHDALFVGWPGVNLSTEGKQVLGELCRNLNSLGRAEGWVECELIEAPPPPWNCMPSEASQNGELVSVFCADPATALGSEYYPKHDPKKLKRGLAPDEHLFDCPHWHLCLDTETIHEQRWSAVPGARWVAYARRRDALDARPATTPTNDRDPTVARFSLDGPALPLVTDTVSVAHYFRSDLLTCFGRRVRSRLGLSANASLKTHPQMCSSILAGKVDGEMIIGSHNHAYFLPTDEDGDGHIDHVTVYAASGFPTEEVAALDTFRKFGYEDVTLRLQLIGLGQIADFRCPIFGPARIWESATPFLVTRHIKERGQKKDPPEYRGINGQHLFVTAVLNEELARKCSAPFALPNVTQLSVIQVGNSRMLPPVAFRRARPQRPGDDGFRRPTGAFRIEFDTPIVGPICVGHSAHFGLGMFLPRATLGLSSPTDTIG